VTTRPAEETRVHTRLLKCTLETEDARAYWQRVDPEHLPADTRNVFDDYWFGARSMDRVEILLSNFRARFDAFPAALRVLHAWQDMDPTARRLICHWHLQLADPLYRHFTGVMLPARRAAARPDVTRALVLAWVEEQGPERWTMATKIQFASKLLSGAFAAGLVTTNRDPRPLAWPRVDDDALTYLLYLLREVEFAGTLLDNPYLASVGLDGDILAARLRSLPALEFRRQADLVEFGWRYPDLTTWARATVAAHSHDSARSA
jgi:hypothetical protein